MIYYKYNPSKGGFEPDQYDTENSMSGLGYWSDSVQDIKNSVEGAKNSDRRK